MNTAKSQLLLLFLLASLAVPAQKNKGKEIAPPKKVAYTSVVKAVSEPVIKDNAAFRWKNEPETLTTFTPDDLVEKVYVFKGTYSVRVISHYPIETVTYKKPGKDETYILPGYTMNFDDYDTVEIKGNTIMLSDKKDPKKEKITLEMIKKGKEIIRIKEVKTGKVFNQSEYSVSPSM